MQVTFAFLDVYLGFVMVYDAESDDGEVHCRLSYSRDGFTGWDWVDPTGLYGAEVLSNNK